MEENKTLDNGKIVVIRFTNRDIVKIKCREFCYDEAEKFRNEEIKKYGKNNVRRL